MRAETKRDFFDGLSRPWRVLPRHHRLYRAFCEDGIAAKHVHVGHLAFGRNGCLQTNQAADLGVPQEIGILGLDRDEHLAIRLCFLAKQCRREAGDEAQH